jgi:hypothetical protein
MYEGLKKYLNYPKMKKRNSTNIKGCLKCQRKKHNSKKYGEISGNLVETKIILTISVGLLGSLTP